MYNIRTLWGNIKFIFHELQKRVEKRVFGVLF